jgi:hypothetical protein
MLNLKHCFLALATASLIAGCSSSGGGGGPSAPTYNGVTTAAAITSGNGEELSKASAAATDEATDQENANDSNPLFFGVEITPSSPELNAFVTDVGRKVAGQLQSLANIPQALTVDSTQLGPEFCGGSITIPDAWQSANSSTTLNGTMTFTNLCVQEGSSQITINGSVTFSETASEISIQYSNFSISDGTSTMTVNMTTTCSTTWTSCSMSADFTGDDAKTYRIDNLNVSGSGTGPYTISARFYHPDHGYVDMSGTGIYYNCADGSPSAGTITLTGSGGSSASITIDSCSAYSGSWDDGTSTGSFSGTF